MGIAQGIWRTLRPAAVLVPYLTVLACLRTSRRILLALPAAVPVKRNSWRG